MSAQPIALPPILLPQSPTALSGSHEVVPYIRQRPRPADRHEPHEAGNRKVEPLVVEYLATSSLLPYEKKLRKHNQKHIAALMGSLRGFGFVAPVIVDDHNVIVDGEALIEAAVRLGIDMVPIVRLSNMTAVMVQACRVAINKLSGGATWDDNLIKFEMIEIAPTLIAHDIELEAIGFSTTEFDLMVGAPASDPAELDEDVALPETPVSKIGDLWRLENNRLLCGNALEEASYARLLNGEKATMAFCDAPYNQKVSDISGLGKAKHKEFQMASGEMTRQAYIEFLAAYMTLCAQYCVDGAVHFACIDWRHSLEMATAGEAAFQRTLNLIVWVKTNAGMGTMYRSQHELIYCFKSGTAPHINNFGLGGTGRWRSNAWQYAGANSFGKGRDADLAAHPTVKPVALVMDAILDVSRRGDIVLDCFTGSGTTINAAHKTGRRGYGIELEPGFVDVAIQRWQSLTGMSATLDGDGRTFKEIKEARLLAKEASNG
jgi:DNA modification methylase